MGTDDGKIGPLIKSVYGTWDVASNWERDWQEHIKSWGYQLGLSSNTLFRHRGHRVSGMTHGDDYVVAGPTDRLAELEIKIASNQNSSDLGLEQGNSVQTPTHDVTEEEPEPLAQVQHSRYRLQVARCWFFSQDRAEITFIVNELCQETSNFQQQSHARLSDEGWSQT